MTTNAKIASDVQLAAPGQYVVLFDLDLTNAGTASILHFVQSTTSSGGVVHFNDVEYTPIDVEADGFEVSGEGLPTPKIRIANVLQSLVGQIDLYDDLLGAVLTRRRTFSKYLDDGSAPDANAQITDVWKFQRKTIQNKLIVEWELSSVLDYEGRSIPNRRMLRDTCLHRYRTYDGGFVYTNATCPYAGSGYFTRAGVACAAADDKCGKKLSDCKLRYPLATDELPTRAFPSIAKTRVK